MARAHRQHRAGFARSSATASCGPPRRDRGEDAGAAAAARRARAVGAALPRGAQHAGPRPRRRRCSRTCCARRSAAPATRATSCCRRPISRALLPGARSALRPRARRRRAHRRARAGRGRGSRRRHRSPAGRAPRCRHARRSSPSDRTSSRMRSRPRRWRRIRALAAAIGALEALDVRADRHGLARLRRARSRCPARSRASTMRRANGCSTGPTCSPARDPASGRRWRSCSPS